MEEQLTTRQVAEALSVSESSVKRWCNRGIIPTVRTVGGHRRIPMDGFLSFLEKNKRQVKAALSDSSRAGKDVDVPRESVDELRRQFRETLAAGDESGCRTLLTRFYASYESVALIGDELIAATFHEFGKRWDCGELEIYQERRGCEICSRLLHELRRLLPEPAATAPLAIGGSPSGDYYTTPSQLVDLVLRESQWRTMNLGCNLPLTTIASAVQQHKPRMLWLSVSHLADTQQFEQAYAAMRADLPPELTIVVGGRALTDGLRPHLAYTGHCDNMQQLRAFAAAVHLHPTAATGSN